eukprot:572209-Pelagomonas_calceolata.AAC.2
MSQPFVLSHDKSYDDLDSRKPSGTGGAGRIVKDFFLDLWDYLKDWKSLPDFDVSTTCCALHCLSCLCCLPVHTYNVTCTQFLNRI